MKLTKILFLSAMAGLTLSGCGDDFFDVAFVLVLP